MRKVPGVVPRPKTRNAVSSPDDVREDEGPLIADVVRQVLPAGSRGNGSWHDLPLWPPDMFAVAATLASLSGCYSDPSYTADGDSCFFDKDYEREIALYGKRWMEATDPNGLRPLQTLWNTLADPNEGHRLLAAPPKAKPWWDAAIKLMAIADYASFGMGFATNDGARPFPRFVIEQHDSLLSPTRRRGMLLSHLPFSLCKFVPPSICCVQPKTRTVQLGCTLRSLSHNLALMPGRGEFVTRWKFAAWEPPRSGPLNLLVVPYPYRIDGSCFRIVDPPPNACDSLVKSGRVNFFEIQPRWLWYKGRRISPARVASFLEGLIAEAEREVGRVHGIVLPEGALEYAVAKAVAKKLSETTDCELFITGATVAGRRGIPARNLIYVCIPIRERGKMFEWEQYKHHRWRLEKDQICRYQLGSILDPELFWWEAIDVSARELDFWVFRHGASLAVLICEDLARIDPVQSAVRSVGPNLLIALLMDGPQLQKRWPARYATVLADDPGSAVLTLTSVGLIARSNMPELRGEQKIALWKDAGTPARELELPKGAHALLLMISESDEEHFTADGRSDDKNTIRLSLSGTIPITHPKPPAWI
jgi:hypothetical protein